MDSATQRVTLVHAELVRLKYYLGTLSPDAWHRPSACTGWEVGDVVAHLTRGAEAYIEWITRGLQGDIAPPPGSPATDTANPTSSSARRVQRAIAVRASLGDQLFTTFQARTDQFNTLMTGLTAQDWEALCYHPTGLQPVRRFVDLYMTELAMHGWDIQSQLEPVAHLSVESLPIFLDLLPDTVRWTFRPGHHLSAPVRYRFVLTERLAPVYASSPATRPGSHQPARIRPISSARVIPRRLCSSCMDVFPGMEPSPRGG